IIRRPPRSTPLYSSAASDVYKRQVPPASDRRLPVPYPAGGPPGRDDGHPQSLASTVRRELNVVEDAAAQESVWQFLLRVGGDHYDGPLLSPYGFPGLRDVEVHLIQLPQQIIRKLQVCFVNLIY